MGGGKSGNNSPSESDLTRMSGPWIPLQQPMKNLATDFTKWYNNGQPYTYGPNVVEQFNPTQKAGLEMGINRASSGVVPGLNATSTNINNVLGAGAQGMPGFNFFNGLGKGQYNNPATGMFRDIAGQAQAGNAAGLGIDTLSRFASGAERGGNPYLSSLLKQGTDEIGRQYSESIMPGMETMLSMTGTGGGGSMEALLRAKTAGEMGKNVGDFSNTFLGNAYNADTDRMMQAAGALPGAEAQRIQTALAGAGGYADINQQNLANRMAGYGAANDQYNQNFANQINGANQLATNYRNSFMPADQMLNYGGMQQTQQERLNAEQQAQHQFSQQADYQRMTDYLRGLTGINSNTNPAAAGAYAQQEMQQQANPLWGNLLAAAGTAADIGGMFYGVPPGAGTATANLLSGATGTSGRNTMGSQLPIWAMGGNPQQQYGR